ncbi:MAG: radical SAM protein [Nanoarchaeota archaeon]
MRFNKVMFIIPAQQFYYPDFPHAGIGYLSEFLIKHGIDNSTIDMRLGYTLEQALKKIKKFNPDLVAVSLTTYNRDIGYKVVDTLKEKGFTVFAGGPHVSTLKTQVLRECKADFGVKLEGEFPLLELCKGKDLREIQNLIFRDGNNIIENENRPFIHNLDELPFPKYEKCEFDKYKNSSISLVTSRGCPYQCTFCSVKLASGMPFRSRTSDNVLEEMKYWNNKGFKYFHIIDDNFTLNKKRVIAISDKIIESGLKVTIACDGVRADMVDQEVLTKMKQAGFKYVSFGVEGGNNKVLQAVKKGESIEQIDDAIKLSTELGFDVFLFFQVGNQSETFEDVQDSINLALKYPICGANFYNTVPYPGTELYDYVKEKGLFIIPPEEYIKEIPYFGDEPVFATPEFSAEERKKALKLARIASRKIKRKALKRRLSKLGTFGDLAYLALRYEFVKDVVLNKVLMKSEITRKFVGSQTAKIFVEN